MRCRDARGLHLDVELSLATVETRAAWNAHVDGCAGCSAWAARERSLTQDLAALAVEVPIPVDVTSRVTSELARMRSVPRDAVSQRQVAWSLAAAAGIGIALVFTVGTLLPDLASAGSDLRALLAAAGRTIDGLAAPLSAILASLARLSGGMLAVFRSVADTLRTLQPAAIATVVSCTVTMAATIAIVLRRDLRRPRWVGEETR